MRSIGVFVDVSNLYYCAKKKFDKRKIDYREYLSYVKDLGEIVNATAYGCHVNDEAKGFIHCLKEIGFQTKYKAVKGYHSDTGLRHKADWDVGITIDIVRLIDQFDMVVLGSADGDLTPAVEWCKEQGKDVLVLACGISKDLKEKATEYIEIPESFLEDRK